MSEAAFKANRTKKLKKIGFAVAEHRRDLTCEVKELLRQWNREMNGKEACIVCGDCEPISILQEHHFNPRVKSEGKYWLCASCHNIFNKIEMTTTKEDVEKDLKLRHERIRRKVTA
jgi:uncharacterized CHY-type Zn-finger protein